MTELFPTEPLIVPQQVRDHLVQYAIARKMPKAKIEAYRTGAADKDPMVQSFVQLYLGVQTTFKGEVLLLQGELADTKTLLSDTRIKFAELEAQLKAGKLKLEAIAARVAGSWWGRAKDLKALLGL